MSGADYQQHRVYRWEDQIVAPRDKTPPVPLQEARTMVHAIWLAEGLFHPPIVTKIRRNSKAKATGSRLELRLPDPCPRWLVLHEMAHTLTSDLDTSDRHGPTFVGMYIRLLEKYLGIPLPLTMFTLSEAKIEYNIDARPMFVD